MGKHGQSSKKHEAPLPDGKMDAPLSAWGLPSSIADLVEETNLGSTGVKEVLNATSPQDALIQTITHPVILAVVVVGGLLLLGRR
jgi:hypothetical protein